MAKKNKEEMCPDCDVPLDDEGSCPSCGWTKGNKAEEGKEANEGDDDWGEEEEGDDDEEEF